MLPLHIEDLKPLQARVIPSRCPALQCQASTLSFQYPPPAVSLALAHLPAQALPSAEQVNTHIPRIARHTIRCMETHLTAAGLGPAEATLGEALRSGWLPDHSGWDCRCCPDGCVRGAPLCCCCCCCCCCPSAAAAFAPSGRGGSSRRACQSLVSAGSACRCIHASYSCMQRSCILDPAYTSRRELKR